jgi:hypothetical protein
MSQSDPFVILLEMRDSAVTAVSFLQGINDILDNGKKTHGQS